MEEPDGWKRKLCFRLLFFVRTLTADLGGSLPPPAGPASELQAEDVNLRLKVKVLWKQAACNRLFLLIKPCYPLPVHLSFGTVEAGLYFPIMTSFISHFHVCF